MHDYHLHTSLCRHAAGSPEAYVERAIAMGLKEICFCDHIPLPDGFDSGHRMDLSEMAVYIDHIESLQRSYNEIDILLGVEADYIEGYEAYLEQFLSDHPFDLVMMSIHFIREWTDGDWVFDFHFPNKSLAQVYSEYFEAVRRGVDTGLFDVVAHLDLIKRPSAPPLVTNRGDIESVLTAVERIGMGIEINTSGLRKPIGDYYPSLDIVEMIASRGIVTTIGSDAHAPEQVGYAFDCLMSDLRNMPPLRIARYRGRRYRTDPLNECAGGGVR